MRVLSRQRGVSLIEVLVAIVIFSVGVLGLALLQIKGAQFTKQAGARSYAIMQVRSLIDAMRANPTVAVLPQKAANPAAPTATECPYCFAGSTPPTLVDCSSVCTPLQTANNDLSLWLTRLKSVAPGPSGGNLATVTWNASLGQYQVSASWSGGSVDSKTATSASDDLTYTLNYMP
ncbi:type IV pilus modification protein PilV [Dyella sp.]|uniref:type IV pilus modification protein PilV n=1 Tax=Dyella sp. TaxID=1869338 RepID=UPI002ED0C164